MSSEEYRVTSEIHEKSDVDASAKPCVCPKNIVTNFIFKVPPFLSWITGNLNGLRVDEDGDLLVRRRNVATQDAVIAIEQSLSTTLQFVGLQVWRGALVLADFMLHNGLSLIKDQTVLELGSGTGLTSIVAAMFAKEVICTVVYDNDLTEAFVRSLEKIMSVPPKKTVYIALEKRYVFTVADLDCVAPCYDFFMGCLDKAQANSNPRWKVDVLPIDFPQYFNYERMKELVLMRISL